MRSRSPSPEDRKVFNSWATAVLAIYSLLAACLFAAILHGSRPPDDRNATSSMRSAVVDRVAPVERHP